MGAHFKALIISKSAARSVFTSTQVAISRKLFQCGYIFNRERAFLQCGSFHASWNCNSCQIYCYIWSRHLAFYLCGSFHVCQECHCLNVLFSFKTCKRLLPCICPVMYIHCTTCLKYLVHIWSMQMASLLCVCSVRFLQLFTPSHLEQVNMASLLCGSFHKCANVPFG